MLTVVAATLATLIPIFGASFGVILLWRKSHRFRLFLSRGLPAVCLPPPESSNDDIVQDDISGAAQAGQAQGTRDNRRRFSAPRGWFSGRYTVSKPLLRRPITFSEYSLDITEANRDSADPVAVLPVINHNLTRPAPGPFWTAAANVSQGQVESFQSSKQEGMNGGKKRGPIFDGFDNSTDVVKWRNSLFAAAQKNASDGVRGLKIENRSAMLQSAPSALAATGDVVLIASTPRTRAAELTDAVFFHSHTYGLGSETQRHRSVQNGQIQYPVPRIAPPKKTKGPDRVLHSDLAPLNLSVSGSPRLVRTPLEDLLASSSLVGRIDESYREGKLHSESRL